MFSTKMNRRDFLKAALVGGVAVGSAPLLNACVVPTPTTPEEEAITLRMWGNHPEWKDPLLEALSFFENETGIDIELEPKPGA